MGKYGKCLKLRLVKKGSRKRKVERTAVEKRGKWQGEKSRIGQGYPPDTPQESNSFS